MSPAVSLSSPNLPVCNSHNFDHRPKTTPCHSSPQEPKLTRRKLLNSTALTLLGAAAPQPAKAEPESPMEATSSRMSYSRFLEYLDQGAVKKVDLFQNGTVAIAEVYNPVLSKMQRVKIQLPGLPQELLRKFEEKDVDFAAHPIEPDVTGIALDLLGNLAFPLLLLGSLFLRNSSGNPGGPNLPFGLGRYIFSSS